MEASIPSIDGRAVLSRADIVARGMPATTAQWLYRNRAATGHPEAANPGGRPLYWFQDEWESWHERYRRRRAETEVDHGGDPQEMVDSAEAARIVGYADRGSIDSRPGTGDFAAPDGYVSGPGGPSPRWRRATLWAWAASPRQAGQGRKPGTASHRAKPHPYAGDARLDAVLAWLGQGRELTARAVEADLRALGHPASPSVAARILTVAKSLHTPARQHPDR